MFNQPEKLLESTLQDNEVKVIRSKYDTVTGQFLDLEHALGYMTARGDSFFDYRYSKEKSKVLYSTHIMKIPNSIVATIINCHRIQYESGAFSESDSSSVFFFLRSTTDRSEEINQYLGSVNLSPIDINISEFGSNFDLNKLDYNNPER